MQGRIINGFTLQHLLGTGGMAEVWYAENVIGIKAAVKILSERLSHDDQMQERFLNEAKVMVKLDHPNIRKVYGFGSINDRPAIIMEYLEGYDLKTRMKNGQRFTQEELKRWWNQLVDALNYTHALDIVHRDIKPSNIFVDQHGNAKLLDFGIAKVIDTTMGTLTGSTLGTRIYMSPEQVKDPKRVGTASDVYSLAVSFVHLLSGKAPYDRTSSSDYEIQESIVRKPVDLSKVSETWRSFLLPYLNKEPNKRPALRHFETNLFTSPVSIQDKEDTTIAEDTGAVPSSAQKAIKSHITTITDQIRDFLSKGLHIKSKKVLWIALAAMIVVLVAIIVFFKKDKIKHLGNEDITFTINNVSFVMKPVEGGTFLMGSNDSVAFEDERPVHSVTVSSFYMGETEVTQALWKAVMWNGNTNNDFPMNNVNWLECQEFISKLNQLTGRNFRLPTEAEWEYAARGGNRSNHYMYAGSDKIYDVAWYYNSGSQQLQPVKTKLPNELGLFDMSGNVWEWCQDWYGDYHSQSQTNPRGPAKGSSRIVRGGNSSINAKGCRVSRRYGYNPNRKDPGGGFRVVFIP